VRDVSAKADPLFEYAVLDRVKKGLAPAQRSVKIPAVQH
jgi:hypothetical protein